MLAELLGLLYRNVYEIDMKISCYSDSIFSLINYHSLIGSTESFLSYILFSLPLSLTSFLTSFLHQRLYFTCHSYSLIPLIHHLLPLLLYSHMHVFRSVSKIMFLIEK